MKKLLFLTLISITSAQAADFQKVYETNLKADQIKQAANITRDRAVITCYQWGVSLQFVGEIIVEPKDNRYRLTFDNMRSVDSGVLLSDLPQTQDSCNQAMEIYGDKLYKKISSWSDF